jgi:hypothetical protein
MSEKMIVFRTINLTKFGHVHSVRHACNKHQTYEGHSYNIITMMYDLKYSLIK